jgi:prophage regulatory protein
MQQDSSRGFLRIWSILGSVERDIPPRIPVSRSTWYAGIKSGKYPQPVKLSDGISAWRASDIAQLCEQLARSAK